MSDKVLRSSLAWLTFKCLIKNLRKRFGHRWQTFGKIQENTTMISKILSKYSGDNNWLSHNDNSCLKSDWIYTERDPNFHDFYSWFYYLEVKYQYIQKIWLSKCGKGLIHWFEWMTEFFLFDFDFLNNLSFNVLE